MNETVLNINEKNYCQMSRFNIETVGAAAGSAAFLDRKSEGTAAVAATKLKLGAGADVVVNVVLYVRVM